MNRKFITAVAIAFSFIFFQSSAALAHHECTSYKHGHGIHAVVHKLDLTKEQKDKIKEIFDRAHDAMKVKDKELNDVRILCMAAYKDGSMNETKIDEFVNKKQQIIGAMIKIKMMERYEIGKVLTVEQKDKVAKIMEEKLKHHKCDGKCHK